MLLNVVNKYGARLSYESVKLPFWQLVLAPDTNPYSASAVRTRPSPTSDYHRRVNDRGNNSDSSGDQPEHGDGVHAPKHTSSTNQVHLGQHINESLNPVHELYCTAFVVMDREFRKADALNMEFNLVLERTHDILLEAIL